jgi:hypothetical protein
MFKLLSYLLFMWIFILTIGCSSQNTSSGAKDNSVPGENSKAGIYKVNLPSPAGNVRSVLFETPATWPDFPDQIQVYQKIKPDVTLEYVKNLASELDLNGEIKQGSGSYTIQVGIKGLTVFSSGGIEYANETDVKEKPILPSEEEAIAIATNAINKIGLLPEGVKGTSYGIGESAAMGVTEGVWPISILIGFKRTINGKYFAGPGAKYQVRIGNAGEVKQMLINPIKYSPLEMVSLKPVDQAFEEMKTAQKYLVPLKANKVIINDIAIAYWLDSITTDQVYIAPIYSFSGQCLDASGNILYNNSFGQQKEEKFTGNVEAVK